MSTAQTFDPNETGQCSDPIEFCDNAVAKVKSLIEDEGDPNLCLRVFITGGGCSGFQYGFTFEESIAEDDWVIARSVQSDLTYPDGAAFDSVRLLVDPMSLQYLTGAKIDYKEDLEGERFVIINPNANTTCGCGSSFSV